LEATTHAANILWKKETGCIVLGDLTLPVLLPSAAQDPYLHQALMGRTKYCRVLWRNVNGERRWLVPLMQTGVAPVKHAVAAGAVVGLDIGSQFPALADGLGALQATEHGDGVGLGFGGLSFPTAQASNDPCGLGKGACVVRVLLLFRLVLQGRQYALQDLNLVRVENVSGFDGTVSIEGQGQLQGEHCGLNGQAGPLGQPFRCFHLAGLKVQSLLIQGSEQWFDVPALPVPGDALQGILKAHDMVRGQQPPVYGRFMAHHTAWQFLDVNNAQLSTQSAALRSCPSRRRDAES
jgi:hypothetical protein